MSLIPGLFYDVGSKHGSHIAFECHVSGLLVPRTFPQTPLIICYYVYFFLYNIDIFRSINQSWKMLHTLDLSDDFFVIRFTLDLILARRLQR